MTQHVLSKEGILTTFSIAKRVSKKNIDKLRSKLKKLNKGNFQNILRKAIMEETKRALISKKIPGVILSDNDYHYVSDDDKKFMMELTYFASVISRKISEKKLDKFYSCYIINAIVNLLRLDEKDFDEFHRKFSRNGDTEDTGESDTLD